MRILLVEDEKRLSEALCALLAKNKYTVDAALDGAYGLDCALSGIYDLIILDIMLPKLDGLTVLRRLREERVSAPVLLLTAKDEVPDRVRGLDCGADDYLTKPFATDELLARVRALCRRQAPLASEGALAFGDLSLDLGTFRLSCGQAGVDCGLKEFEIMRLLMLGGRRIVSKEELLSRVWGYESDAEYNNVEVYISFLRKKLAHLSSRTSIKTVRGLGYALEEPS